MMLEVSGLGTRDTFQYNVTSGRFSDFNQIIYRAPGLSLEVDLWPDSNPRWGRSYSATLNSTDLNNEALVLLECHFPNAN